VRWSISGQAPATVRPFNQDATGPGRGLAEALMPSAIGATRAGILENQFSRKKPETDLFGEQACFCGRP